MLNRWFTITPSGTTALRHQILWVAGPPAFVALRTLAVRNSEQLVLSREPLKEGILERALSALRACDQDDLGRLDTLNLPEVLAALVVVCPPSSEPGQLPNALTK